LARPVAAIRGERIWRCVKPFW